MWGSPCCQIGRFETYGDKPLPYHILDEVRAKEEPTVSSAWIKQQEKDSFTEEISKVYPLDDILWSQRFCTVTLYYFYLQSRYTHTAESHAF